jgi:predicted nucleic acid-binding protein
MIYDTDMIIWVQRGNAEAAGLIDNDRQPFVSIVTYMELLQNAKSKTHVSIVKSYLTSQDFSILPLTENIGHRASIYVEEYTLSHGISATDALIAATAVENDLVLCSSNSKHYRPIRDLRFKRFVV